MGFFKSIFGIEKVEKELAAEWQVSIGNIRRIAEMFYDSDSEHDNIGLSLEMAGWHASGDGMYAMTAASEVSKYFAYTFVITPSERLYLVTMMHRDHGQCPVRLVYENGELAMTKPKTEVPKLFEGIIEKVRDTGVFFRTMS